MPDKDYYSILGVTESASLDDIKSAYRRLAMKYHPDRVPEAEKKSVEERFKEITEAYYVLADPKRRKRYDNYRKGAYAFKGSYGAEDFASKTGFDFEEILRHFSGLHEKKTRKRRGYDKYFFFDDLADIFEGMHFDFGGGGHFYEAHSFEGDESQPQYDTNIYADLAIPRKIAINGGEAQFKLNSGNTIFLKINPGTKDGQRMRLRGLGKDCPTCAHKGDLIVALRYK